MHTGLFFSHSRIVMYFWAYSLLLYIFNVHIWLFVAIKILKLFQVIALDAHWYTVLFKKLILKGCDFISNRMTLQDDFILQEKLEKGKISTEDIFRL